MLQQGQNQYPWVRFLMRVTTAFSELCFFSDWENALEGLARKRDHRTSQIPNGHNGNSGSSPFRFPQHPALA